MLLEAPPPTAAAGMQPMVQVLAPQAKHGLARLLAPKSAPPTCVVREQRLAVVQKIARRGCPLLLVELDS